MSYKIRSLTIYVPIASLVSVKVMLDHLIAALDTDGDGEISKEEWNALSKLLAAQSTPTSDHDASPQLVDVNSFIHAA